MFPLFQLTKKVWVVQVIRCNISQSVCLLQNNDIFEYYIYTWKFNSWFEYNPTNLKNLILTSHYRPSIIKILPVMHTIGTMNPYRLLSGLLSSHPPSLKLYWKFMRCFPWLRAYLLSAIIRGSWVRVCNTQVDIVFNGPDCIRRRPRDSRSQWNLFLHLKVGRYEEELSWIQCPITWRRFRWEPLKCNRERERCAPPL